MAPLPKGGCQPLGWLGDSMPLCGISPYGRLSLRHGYAVPPPFRQGRLMLIQNPCTNKKPLSVSDSGFLHLSAAGNITCRKTNITAPPYHSP